jgi:hypothetical protein
MGMSVSFLFVLRSKVVECSEPLTECFEWSEKLSEAGRSILVFLMQVIETITIFEILSGHFKSTIINTNV